MPKSFSCPHCGGPLEYSGEAATMSCPFCGTSVIIPEELRPQKPVVQQVVAEQVVIRSATVKTPAWVSLFIFLGSLVVVGLGVYWSTGSLPWNIMRNRSSQVSQIANVPTIVVPTYVMPYFVVPTLPPEAVSGLATVSALAGTPAATTPSISQLQLKFGSEGTGVGRFTDARTIGLDSTGNIYVGEYTGGRVQVFDSTGKYLREWNIGDSKTLLMSMATDRQGAVYAVAKGQILRIDGATGKTLGTFSYSGGNWFDSVAVRPAGGVVATWFGGQDDLIQFDSNGKVVRKWTKFVSTQTDSPALNNTVAVDGTGNIFVLAGLPDDTVFQFNSDGKFITRIGGKGDGPGQLSAPNSIAVDGRSRVYVSDIWGIEIFGADGHFIQRIPTGPTFGMAFDDQDNLYIAGRTQVLKYSILAK